MIQLFFLLLVFSLTRTTLDFSYSVLGLNLGAALKVAYGLTFILSLVYLAARKYRKLHPVSVVFLLIFLSGTVQWVANGSDFDGTVLVQLSYIFGPLVFLNAGFNIDQRSAERLCGLLDRYIVAILIYLCLLFALYVYLHYFVGAWEYFGYSSGLVFAAILAQRRLGSLKTLALVVADFFSGKRSSLLMWLAYLGVRKPIFVPIVLAMFAAAAVTLGIARYTSVLDIDFTDDYSMYVATGGRYIEWKNAVAHINSVDLGPFLGSGLGSRFVTADLISQVDELQQYSHFTPLTYALIGGYPLAAVLYVALFYYSARFSGVNPREFRHYWLVMLALSFMGPALITEPWPWLFFGILSTQARVRYVTL